MIRKFIIPASIIILTLIGCGKKREIKDSNVDSLLSAYLKKGSYNIISTESELKWIGKELSTNTHTGTLVLKNGKIDVNEIGVIHG